MKKLGKIAITSLLLAGIATFTLFSLKDNPKKRDINYYPYKQNQEKHSLEYINTKERIDSVSKAKLDSLEGDYLFKRRLIEGEYRQQRIENEIKESNGEYFNPKSNN